MTAVMWDRFYDETDKITFGAYTIYYQHVSGIFELWIAGNFINRIYSIQHIPNNNIRTALAYCLFDLKVYKVIYDKLD